MMSCLVGAGCVMAVQGWASPQFTRNISLPIYGEPLNTSTQATERRNQAVIPTFVCLLSALVCSAGGGPGAALTQFRFASLTEWDQLNQRGSVLNPVFVAFFAKFVLLVLCGLDKRCSSIAL